MLFRERLSDAERRNFILTDPNLYNWYRAAKVPLAQFIARNRAELDEVIELKLTRKENNR